MKVLSLLILLIAYYNNDSTIFYHSFQATESIPKVVRWNIDSTSQSDFYIREKTDSLNRVVEIAFFHKNDIFDIWPMYGVPIIRYQYLKNKIFEYYFDKNGYLLSFEESESPFCRIYHVDENKNIISCVKYYYMGKQKEKEIDINNTSYCRKEKCDADYIIYYLYSYNKMNGTFPKTNGFSFDKEILKQVYSKSLLENIGFK